MSVIVSGHGRVAYARDRNRPEDARFLCEMLFAASAWRPGTLPLKVVRRAKMTRYAADALGNAGTPLVLGPPCAGCREEYLA